MSALPATIIAPSADDIAAFENSHAVAAKKPGRALRVVVPDDTSIVVPPAYPTIVTDGLTGRSVPTPDPYESGDFSAADVAPTFVVPPTVAPRVGATVRKNAPFPDGAVITILHGNTRKPGTKTYARFAAYGPDATIGSTTTVGEFLARGGLMADLVWDSSSVHKHIKIAK